MAYSMNGAWIVTGRIDYEQDRIARGRLPARHDPESCGPLQDQAGLWWVVLIPIGLGIIALVVVLGWVGLELFR
jgi:hypothetical protein